HLFAYKIDGPSAGAAEGLTVRYRPAGLFGDFLATVRAREGKLDDDGDVGHEAFSSPESLRQPHSESRLACSTFADRGLFQGRRRSICRRADRRTVAAGRQSFGRGSSPITVRRERDIS